MPYESIHCEGRAMTRVGALDLGETVGLAVEDALGLLAHPRGTLNARNPRDFLNALNEWIQHEKITRLIVGLPVDMKGDEGQAARKVRTLAQTIANATGCEVELWDERWTTVQAYRRLKESGVRGRNAKRHVDEAAAVAILQSWLDAQREA